MGNFFSDAFNAMDFLNVFGGNDDNDKTEEHINTITQAYRDVLGRDPDPEGLQNYLSAIQNKWKGIDSPAKLRADLMESDEYKERFKRGSGAGGGGGGLGEGGGGGYGGGWGGGGPVDSYLAKIEQIAASPLASKEATYDNTAVEAERAKIRDYIEGIRSGRIAPEVTSPELRQNLIDKASGTYQRLLDASQTAAYEDLNRRGLLPSTSTGFSGPATDVLTKNRAAIYEDPLTSFIRDFDIQQEMERVTRQKQLNDIATQLQSGMLSSAEAEAQIKANLALQNINSQRAYTQGTFGNILDSESAAAARDLQGRIAEMQNETARAELALRESLGLQGLDLQREQMRIGQEQWQAQQDAADNDSGLWGTLGTIGGTILGSSFGPIGSTIGGTLGGSLGSSLGGGSGAATGFSSLFPYAYNSYSKPSYSSSTPNYFSGLNTGYSGGVSSAYDKFINTSMAPKLNPFTSTFTL